MLINAPRSRADNNVNALANQTANYNSSAAGQWDNAQGFIGVSNPVYGTLTFGRTNSLALDALTSYDPVASTAFSPFGFTSSFAGFGNSPTVRPNTAFTYRLNVGNFRLAAQAQVGGYAIGNASNGQYQGQIGADFGDLSLDGVVNWTRDAVSLSSYTGNPPSGYDVNSVLKATLSNSAGVELMARYTWGPRQVLRGLHLRASDEPERRLRQWLPDHRRGHLRSTRRSDLQRLRCEQDLQHRVDGGAVFRCGATSISQLASTIARKMIICPSRRRLHRLRHHDQQQQMRRQPRRRFVPDRLQAGRAGRSLCRRDGLGRVGRLRERASLHAKRRSDCRPAHPVLTPTRNCQSDLRTAVDRGIYLVKR